MRLMPIRHVRTAFLAPAPKLHAFTLVELLVVIAIISVLAAMLLPALEGAMASARRMECLNKPRQISLGLRMYADDFSGYLPARNGNQPMIWGEAGGVAGLDDLFAMGYLENKRLKICPSKDNPVRNIPPADNRFWNEPNPAWKGTWSSYVYSGGSASIKTTDATGKIPYMYVIRLDLHDPGEALLLDALVLNSWGMSTGSYDELQQTNHFRNGRNEGGNAVYVDGSGKWLPGDTNHWTRSNQVAATYRPAGTHTLCWTNTRNVTAEYFFADDCGGGFSGGIRGSCFKLP